MFEEYAEHDIAVYGGYLINEKELLECTSGGIATALANKMIEQGGYVAGVTYSEDYYSAKYELVHLASEIEKFKGSKYIEVDKGNIYKAVKEILDEDECVLFFGLPCIVAALKSFLGKEYKNLLTCELVCHGPTSAKVHREYIQHLENRFNSKVIDFSVRMKKEAWLPTYLYAKFQNGKIFEEEFYRTEYGYAFSVMGRPSCYHCNFKGNNRTGDIMIGDFWGATENDPFWNKNGVSVIFVHTEKGNCFLEGIDTIRLFETTFEKAVSDNRMVIESRKSRSERAKFERLFSERGLIYAAQHSKNLKRKIKELIVRCIPSSLKPALKNVYIRVKKKLPV